MFGETRKTGIAVKIERKSLGGTLYKYRRLYILLIPGVLHYILFRYVPMAGLVMAFQKFTLYGSVFTNQWVGLANFKKIMADPEFFRIIKNTFLLGISSLLWGLPIPIMFAILLNELKVKRLKKIVQSVSFFPSLLSVVVVCSMAIDFLSPNSGVINRFIETLGFDKHYFMIDPKWFRTIYISTGVWQMFGYNAIIYFAAISGISDELYDAADIDGCGRFGKILHVTLPGLLPTICTMAILNAGNMFRIGADKVLLLYNPMTYETADIFGSFVYRKGIRESSYSFAAAAGMFESVVAFVMVITANKLSKRFADNSLW